MKSVASPSVALYVLLESVVEKAETSDRLNEKKYRAALEAVAKGIGTMEHQLVL
jgi:hypothetical protein